jgi:hypothetical protein
MTPLSRHLIIALAISGALNFLCAGLFIGRAINRSRARAAYGRFEQRPPRRGAEARRGPGPFGGALAGHRDEMVARRRAVADARKAVAAALEHEPFDGPALDQAFAKLRAETEATQELVHKTLAQAAHDGDADARKKIALGFARPGPASP